jgi:hypothetical protein
MGLVTPRGIVSIAASELKARPVAFAAPSLARASLGPINSQTRAEDEGLRHAHDRKFVIDIARREGFSRHAGTRRRRRDRAACAPAPDQTCELSPLSSSLA